MVFTDLGDVHDFDGRQLSRFDMSALVRKEEEGEIKEMELCVFLPTEDVETVARMTAPGNFLLSFFLKKAIQ